jgi:hypothetical protein
MQMNESLKKQKTSLDYAFLIRNGRRVNEIIGQLVSMQLKLDTDGLGWGW